jgi:hypothetical protein
MKAAIAHSPRLFHRVRQLLIVHTPQSHLASFRESAVFAIASCSSLSCSSCCSTSGLAATGTTATCLRNHPLVRSNRFICSHQALVTNTSPLALRYLPLQVLAPPPRCQKTNTQTVPSCIYGVWTILYLGAFLCACVTRFV